MNSKRNRLSTGDGSVVAIDTPPPPSKKRTRAVAAASGPSNIASASGSRKADKQKEKVEHVPKSTGVRRAGPASVQKKASFESSQNDTAQRMAVADPPAPPQCDDADGHYIINKDDVINGRYRVLRKIGEGTYGKVVKAVNLIDNKAYAVKIIRARHQYREASTIEIKVLDELKRGDPDNVHKCIHLKEFFDHRNHVCLVFELLGQSVFDFLKKNSFAPFPMAHIQDFGRQLIASVAYLHRLGIVHTDLKPENILLADSSYKVLPAEAGRAEQMILIDPDIRLIDFGTAAFVHGYHPPVVSTRHYRAPEVILGLGWSFPCDMFSVGCILIELFTGQALFQTKSNPEHLAIMHIVMGPMPVGFRRNAARRNSDLFKDGKLDYPNERTAAESREFLAGIETLKEIIPSNNVERSRFYNLIDRLLRFDPAQRLSASDALKHNFFELNMSIV